MADVSDVDPDLEVAVVQLSAVQGVVDVCASRRIHAAHRQLPQVLPPGRVLESAQRSQKSESPPAKTQA